MFSYSFVYANYKEGVKTPAIDGISCIELMGFNMPNYMGWIAAPDSVSSLEHSSVTLLAEELLQEFALFLKVCLEGIAILTVAIAVILTLRKILRFWRRSHVLQETIRLELGVSLALSLEFLLAADIVGTAVSPSWDAVAKLAAITGIRTFLNFFLQREVQELRETSHLPEG